jgi:hypothetical protein
MSTRANAGRRLLAAGAILAGSLLGAGTASAQGQTTDARWQPWLGCWAPASAIGTTQTSSVCVIPAGGTAVDLVTIADGKVTDREHIDANGERLNVTKDGCPGWEQASFAPGAARVYVHSQYDCSGGLVRRSNGVLAFGDAGEWIDVRGITAGTQNGVRVVHFRTASDSLALPAEIAAVRPTHALPSSTARLAASAPITVADIIDASSKLDASVVQAWLIEHGGQYKIDAAKLTELAKNGVPGSVTDLLVALTYPRVFSVGLAMRGGEVRQASGTQVADAGGDGREIPVYMYPSYGYGGFGSNPFFYGYSPYGYNYSPYGYGNPYGWYGGNNPVVIVVKDPNPTTTVGGHAVRGRGFTRHGDGSSGTATPRSSVGGSSSSGGSASVGSGSSSSTGSSTGRTAHKRP